MLNLFAVTLDYKALLLLLQKGDDEEFILGGKGHGEFCSYCDVIRVSTVTNMITMLLYTCNDLELNVIALHIYLLLYSSKELSKACKVPGSYFVWMSNIDISLVKD